MCRCHRQFLPMLKPSQLKELKSMQLSRDPSETYKGGVGPKRFTRPKGFVCRLYPILPDRRGSKGGLGIRRHTRPFVPSGFEGAGCAGVGCLVEHAARDERINPQMRAQVGKKETVRSRHDALAPVPNPE